MLFFLKYDWLLKSKYGLQHKITQKIDCKLFLIITQLGSN